MTTDTFTNGQRRPYESPDVQVILVSPMNLVCISPGDAPGLGCEYNFGTFDVPDLPGLPEFPGFTDLRI